MSYEAYLDFLEKVFAAVCRVTKEGALFNRQYVACHRAANYPRARELSAVPIPSCIHARLSRIGWDFIDDIVWEKPEFSVKNRIGSFSAAQKAFGV